MTDNTIVISKNAVAETQDPKVATEDARINTNKLTKKASKQIAKETKNYNGLILYTQRCIWMMKRHQQKTRSTTKSTIRTHTKNQKQNQTQNNKHELLNNFMFHRMMKQC